MKNSNDKFRITEMIGAKPSKDWTRFFYGSIVREKNSEGVENLVRGKINIDDPNYNGMVYSIADNPTQLLDNLDELVTLALDKGLHNPTGVTSKIMQISFHHN